ncbi:MAG: protein kinase [Myxococcales bacterium]|nr:protein kinase [Myxococcales bacterium]
MSASSDETAPTFPERVGRYELLLPIGTGGMATVYLARVAVVGDVHREVALKLLHPFMQAEGRESSISLMEEAKLAVRIRHPNVVPVIEVGDGPHGVFLVMEYVEGDTLSGLHRTVRADGHMLPLRIAGRVLMDALAGLHAAHELRDDDGVSLELVHRDFSPQNILVGSDGVSRLTDFGVAKSAGRVNVTTSGIIKGKVAYMAPEQALGKKVDRRCDVWAAGVVAWEILAGQRLYKQEDQLATLLKIVNEPPPRLKTVRPEIASELDQVIADALTMDLEQRIPNAAALRQRLTEAWRAAGGLADAQEVGEFVDCTARQKISARREQVSRVIKLRGSLAKVSNAASRAAHESSGSLSTRGPGNEDTTSAISASSIGAANPGRISADSMAGLRPAERSYRGLFIGALVVAAGAVGFAIWMGGRTPRAETVTNTPPPSSAPASTPATPASPSPSAVAAATPSTVELSVEFNAPLKALKVNGRHISLEPHARLARVTLSADERKKSIELEGVAEDQRKTRTTVEPGAEAARLTFSEVKHPAAAAPAGQVVRDSPKPPELPGLAPTPYEK